MAEITDLSALVNRLSGGNSGTPEHRFFVSYNRDSAGNSVNGIHSRLQSAWRFSGIPGLGVTPAAAAAIPTNATDGCLKTTNPGGGRQKWLLGMLATASTAMLVILYDRLMHSSGLSGTVTSAQTVNTPALSRYGGAASVGNQIWLEIYTIVGATGTTVTASYTNQDGTAARTTVAATFGGTNFREAHRLIVLPLQAGDTGVRSVETVTVLATTGTVGDFGVVIARPLSQVDIIQSPFLTGRDHISGLPTIPEILTNACLSLATICRGTSTQYILSGSIHMVEA